MTICDVPPHKPRYISIPRICIHLYSASDSHAGLIEKVRHFSARVGGMREAQHLRRPPYTQVHFKHWRCSKYRPKVFIHNSPAAKAWTATASARELQALERNKVGTSRTSSFRTPPHPGTFQHWKYCKCCSEPIMDKSQAAQVWTPTPCARGPQALGAIYQ